MKISLKEGQGLIEYLSNLGVDKESYFEPIINFLKCSINELAVVINSENENEFKFDKIFDSKYINDFEILFTVDRIVSDKLTENFKFLVNKSDNRKYVVLNSNIDIIWTKY